MKKIIYNFLPHFLQNLMVSLYNMNAYRIRYGGKYKYFRTLFAANRSLSLFQLQSIQRKRLNLFIHHSILHSEFYRKLYEGVESPENIDYLNKLPIISKEELRKNIDKIVVSTTEDLVVSKTGGTTGKSLEVKVTVVNSQERFAMLDDFRSRFGYKLGKKTAWFSGKSLLTSTDIRKHRFWKTDYQYKVRYYSTFHISEKYLKYYVDNLIKYKPEYFVGFPSTILEIAKYGIRHGYDFPSNVVKAIFPTAETVTKEMRTLIESFFKTKMYDQYASSEGAPFIFECVKGHLHLELQSGVFEVLDDDDKPAKSGRLVVTSFTTEGTPLIRYDIGDRITLEDKDEVCGCGNNNPMVKEIIGRIDDYVYSPDTGKIYLGNVSNTLKDTKGIVRFQARQDYIHCIELLLVVDLTVYNDKIEKKFLQNWRERTGVNMDLLIKYVDTIPVEKSGKFRIVKNNIKHLIN